MSKQSQSMDGLELKTAPPSVVRSVRQRELLNCWLRLFSKRNFAPCLEDFTPERSNEEEPDLVESEIVFTKGRPRFKILKQGGRVTKLFGVRGTNRYLDDVLGAAFTHTSRRLYDECVFRGRPAYSISMVEDVAKRPVAYERLLLPFCAGARMDRMLASLKPISIEGAFEATNLMVDNQEKRKYLVYAIIDEDLQISPVKRRSRR
jgi:hypothetical protein